MNLDAVVRLSRALAEAAPRGPTSSPSPSQLQEKQYTKSPWGQFPGEVWRWLQLSKAHILEVFRWWFPSQLGGS